MYPEDQPRLAQLETATAPVVPEGVPLDAETESLRESWLGLAQLLQTAEEPLDATTAARLRRTSRRAATPKCQTTPQRRTGSAKLAAGFAAAALLAAIVVWTASYFGQQGSSANVDSIAKQTSPPMSHPAEFVPRNASPLPHDLPEPRDDTAADEPSELFAWNDSFDAQLARVDDQLDTLVHTWRSDDIRYYTFEQQVRELETELSGKSL